MVKSLKPLWEENLQLSDIRKSRPEPHSSHAESSRNLGENSARGILGSARSQKSSSVYFKAPAESPRTQTVKQTVQKPERKSKKQKK